MVDVRSDLNYLILIIDESVENIVQYKIDFLFKIHSQVENKSYGFCLLRSSLTSFTI